MTLAISKSLSPKPLFDPEQAAEVLISGAI
jgi:hypothetical protein